MRKPFRKKQPEFTGLALAPGLVAEVAALRHQLAEANANLHMWRALTFDEATQAEHMRLRTHEISERYSKELGRAQRDLATTQNILGEALFCIGQEIGAGTVFHYGNVRGVIRAANGALPWLDLSLGYESGALRHKLRNYPEFPDEGITW